MVFITSFKIYAMPTSALRKDHDLIEKAVSAMKTTASLLKDGKKIPESILLPTIDFAKNFTNVCHHGKEENALFPALAKVGVPTTMGPIAAMLKEHETTKLIAEKIEEFAKKYLETGDSANLVDALDVYVEHVSAHLWKENNRLFLMANARLQAYGKEVVDALQETETAKLAQLGKTRGDYEKMVDDLKENLGAVQ
jgi:hemerythrin-like domain-containing protein|tara:strand:+ start:443 stop:1030 length:588 start_codon:yes stop_codon:yes gene_type:complete